MEREEAMHLAIILVDGLWLMLLGWYGEVDGQDREWIDQELESVVYLLSHLHLRSVLITEEARAFAQGLLIYLGSRAHDASWVPLELYQLGELLGLHMLEVTEAMAGILPFLQLAIEEARDATILHDVCLALEHLLASLQFHGAQAVLVEIVGIHTVNAQRGITVASPATTEIEFVIDSADAITARESQAEGIVLTIGGVRELDLANQWGKEGARCAQAIDTQGIVAAIIISPFLVVDESRRQGVEVEITHAIRANHHRCLLLVEGIHYLLQGLWR